MLYSILYAEQRRTLQQRTREQLQARLRSRHSSDAQAFASNHKLARRSFARRHQVRAEARLAHQAGMRSLVTALDARCDSLATLCTARDTARCTASATARQQRITMGRRAWADVQQLQRAYT